MENKGVMIFAEVADGKLAPITRELLGAGRKLANDLGEELSVMIAGSGAVNTLQGGSPLTGAFGSTGLPRKR